MFDNGYWELIRGTGHFEGMRGVGSLIVKPASGPKRAFLLDGEVRPAR